MQHNIYLRILDAGEGMAAGPEEHLISIPVHNAREFGGSDGPDSDEEDSIVPIEWNFQEWTEEVNEKMNRTFTELSDYWEPLVSKREEPKICKLTVREMISQQSSKTEEGLSQPTVVTIGPFHRKDPTRISDKEKWVIVCLTNLLHNLDLERSLSKMKDQVKKARNSYYKLDVSESSDFNGDKKSFAEMLLLDSYFILFMLTIRLRKGPTDYTLMPLTPNEFTREPLKLFPDGPFKFLDTIFNKVEIALDLLIFDNQLPFFVIKKLFKELKLDTPLHEYALEFFETIHPRSARHCMDQNRRPTKFLHLLDLFHWSRVPRNKYINLSSSPQQPDVVDWVSQTLNAMELRESAIVFEKKTSESSLDITFHRRWFKRIIRVFRIPELHILDYSSLIFYNLIAFETQSSTRGRCTMAFSALMRSFLQSEEDVKLLRQRGILVSSSMTDRQLIDLFARLSRLTENHQMPQDLFAICRRVQSHHRNLVNRLCGGIILQYFSKPVVTLSVLVAALLFVPTLLQTIYSMIYHN